MATALPFYEQSPILEWVAFISLVAFVIGYAIFVIPGVFIAVLLPIPAWHGDRAAWIGLVAVITAFALWWPFWHVVYP